MLYNDLQWQITIDFLYVNHPYLVNFQKFEHSDFCENLFL